MAKGVVGGAALRITQTALRILELLCGIVVLAIYSYFLAVLSDHHLPIGNWVRAVEGMSGASVLYLLFAVVLTLCLGGIRFFALIAVILDVCFIGCYVAIAWFNRGGAGKCSGTVYTVLGSGPANSKDPGYGQNGFGFGSGENVTYAPNLRQACKLETAVFAVAVINIFLFLITAVLQVLLARHHQKEKRYGPGPSNDYTSGVGRRPFWKRNKKANYTRDAEMATAGAAVGARHSHDTGLTGNTMHNTDGGLEPKYGQEGYGNATYSSPTHTTTTTTNGYGNTNTTHGYGQTATNY